jgi:hypothetical protein
VTHATHAALSGIVLIAVAGTTRSATAQVTFFTNAATFNAAAPTSLEATFEGLSEGNQPNPLTLGRVTILSTDGWVPVIAQPGGPNEVYFDPSVQPLMSSVLTSSGSEAFTFTFSGPAPTAVAFDVITNLNPGPSFAVFNTVGTNIGTFSLAAPGTVAFLGITSTVPIGRIQSLGVGGDIVNTAIDNVRVGVSAVPEPGTVWLLAGGLAGALTLRLRRRT